jgi:hypothetical protein
MRPGMIEVLINSYTTAPLLEPKNPHAPVRFLCKATLLPPPIKARRAFKPQDAPGRGGEESRPGTSGLHRGTRRVASSPVVCLGAPQGLFLKSHWLLGETYPSGVPPASSAAVPIFNRVSALLREPHRGEASASRQAGGAELFAPRLLSSTHSAQGVIPGC